MKKSLSILLALVLVFSLFAGCAPTAPEPTPESTSGDFELKITAEGLDLTLSAEDMAALPQEEFETTNVDSNGEVSEVEVSGFSVAAILEENGLDIGKTATAVLTASDGYVMTATVEEYGENGLYVLLTHNGDVLTAPRSCIPEKRAMYWVKDLVSIEFTDADSSTEGGDVAVENIQFFWENASSMTATDLTYNEASYPFYSLSEYFDTYVGELTAPVKMIAKDGFEKPEPVEVFLSSYVGEIVGDIDEATHAPFYYSEDLSNGMRVKQLDMVIAGENAIYFGKEISVPDLLASVGMDGAEKYLFIASDGFETEVPSDAIEFGKIYPDDEEGYIRASFEGYDWGSAKGGGKVKYLSSITAVGTATVSSDGGDSDPAEGDASDETLLKCFVGDEKVMLTEADFLALPQMEIELTRTNSFDETTTATYKGVHWKDLAAAIGADADVSVTFVASDGFEIKHTSDVLNAEDSMLALYQDGEYIESDGAGRIWFCAGEEFTANNWAKFIEKIVID